MTVFKRPMEPFDDYTHRSYFSTERLRLRKMVLEDAETLFATKSNPRVTCLYGESPHRSIEDTRKWVRECIDATEKHSAMIWTIESMPNDQVIGMVCLWNFHLLNHCAELGYELDPDHWRQGIMTEALMPIITYGFTVVGLNRLEAVPLAINVGSRSLLHKYGFKEEGVLRERVFYDGRYFDEVYFALLKKDWSGTGTTS